MPVNKIPPVLLAAPEIGDVIVTTGNVVSKLIEVAADVPVFPATSVWLTVMALVPSPLASVIVPEYVPEAQLTVVGVCTPLPLMVTLNPASHAPETAKLDVEFVYALLTGMLIVGVGAALSTVIVALGPAMEEAFPLESVAVPVAMLTVTVPFPVQLLRAKLRLVSDAPDTVTKHVALPVTVLTVT